MQMDGWWIFMRSHYLAEMQFLRWLLKPEGFEGPRLYIELTDWS